MEKLIISLFLCLSYKETCIWRKKATALCWLNCSPTGTVISAITLTHFIKHTEVWPGKEILYCESLQLAPPFEGIWGALFIKPLSLNGISTLSVQTQKDLHCFFF